ncbi:DNA polymerase III subunit delta, partial [Laribacter hongkongensis]
ALQASVADVARFDVFQLNAAWLAGETARVTRMLAGLEAEGEAPVLALWSVAEELRSLIRIRIGLRDGKPMAQLLRENRMWGERQRLAEPALRRLGQARLQAALSECAAIDRAIKGAGPGEPWRRLEALLVGLCRTN